MTDKGHFLKKAQAVKALVLDVDGVLTDGSIIYDSNGQQIQGFFVRDGLGLKLISDAGIKIAIITARSSRALERRCQDLRIDLVFQGAKDKVSCLMELTSRFSIDLKEVCGMGDDLLDLPMLKRCGISATVADAPFEVKSQVDFVSNYPGGRGAVREICELILKAKGQWQQVLEGFK